MNAVGHLLFLSPDSSSDPLPTIAGLWVFYQASLDASYPIGNRGLLVPPLLPAGKWLGMEFGIKAGAAQNPGNPSVREMRHGLGWRCYWDSD